MPPRIEAQTSVGSTSPRHLDSIELPSTTTSTCPSPIPPTLEAPTTYFVARPGPSPNRQQPINHISIPQTPPAPSVCCCRPAGSLPSVDSAARRCQSPPGSRTRCQSGPVAVAVESTRALSAPTPTPPHRPSPLYHESLSPGHPLKIAHHVQGYAKRPECDQGLLQRPGQGPRRYVAIQCENPTSRVGAAQRWRGIIWADDMGTQRPAMTHGVRREPR